jgi:hypothetical protein
MNETTRDYALVESVESDHSLLLSQDIMAAGDSYEVFESGGTVNGTGHIQRDWLVTSVNNSLAKWKFIVCEIPFLHDEETSGDKWADYDPLDAQRKYLQEVISATNVIWINADGHYSALDDGSHPDDPWPSVACANLSCTYGKDPRGTWFVDGQPAEWSADDGARGGFCVIKVRSDRVEIEACHPDGSKINNGSIDLTMTVPYSTP